MNPDPIPLSARALASPQVLVQEVDGHSALLHLGSERYYGLDDVGTRMWETLVGSPTIGHAIERLEGMYDAPPERIHADALALIGQLVEAELLELQP
jgi:hypothetical protein